MWVVNNIFIVLYIFGSIRPRTRRKYSCWLVRPASTFSPRRTTMMGVGNYRLIDPLTNIFAYSVIQTPWNDKISQLVEEPTSVIKPFVFASTIFCLFLWIPIIFFLIPFLLICNNFPKRLHLPVLLWEKEKKKTYFFLNSLFVRMCL